MKKVIALLLALLCVASCFAGCNSQEEDYTNKTVINVQYWRSGLGIQWLETMADAFEAKYPQYKIVIDTSSDQTSIKAALGYADLDETDLYFATKDYNYDGYLEPLDDVLSAVAEGESKTIGEKFNPYYLELEKSSDGHYYNLTYCGGVTSIYYNKAVFAQGGITQEPRTTDELAEVAAALAAKKISAFCHFAPVGYWETAMSATWFVQYDGLDYVKNNFYGCTDENGNSPSKEVFLKKDGRYETLKVMADLITPTYTLSGSNSYDHTTIQTMWLQGQAAMMNTGSWIVTEMSSVEGLENIMMMRSPVISSITDKLTTVKTDEQLRKVITAIDNVTEGVKAESDYRNGDNYTVDGLTVSAADWNYVKAARNTLHTNASQMSAFIPNYSAEKEGAKEFLKFLYSDEGYKLYTGVTHQVLPLSLDKGQIDTTGWTDLEIRQMQIVDTTEQLFDPQFAGVHKIFSVSLAYWKNYAKYYVDKFCSRSEADAMTADEAWADTIQWVNDRYDLWVSDLED